MLGGSRDPAIIHQHNSTKPMLAEGGMLLPAHMLRSLMCVPALRRNCAVPQIHLVASTAVYCAVLNNMVIRSVLYLLHPQHGYYL